VPVRNASPAANRDDLWRPFGEPSSDAVGALRPGGRVVDDEVLAHSWPTHHENVPFFGADSVDIEPAQLDDDGYRPLRVAPTATGG
jgi:hypothetical protein